MKTRKYKTIDGEEVELQIPETLEEEAEVQVKMASGEVDDSHSFADARGKKAETKKAP